MSLSAVRVVWDRSKSRGTARLVLLAIAEFVNEQRGHIAWPGIATLAKRVRSSERQVQRVIRALEKSGELQVFRNAGPKGTNQYRILIAAKDSPGDEHTVTSDKLGSTTVSFESANGDVAATQSDKEPIYNSTPIVPSGDEGFWIDLCFLCFKQKIRPLSNRVLNALNAAIPYLEKKYGGCLLEFYRSEPIDSKLIPFNSRKHSPERLICDLPRQLALAAKTSPPRPPKKEEPPRWEDFCHWKHPGCSPPKSFYELPCWVQRQYESEYRNFLAHVGHTEAKVNPNKKPPNEHWKARPVDAG
jgi:hypothetical protein